MPRLGRPSGYLTFSGIGLKYILWYRVEQDLVYEYLSEALKGQPSR